MRPVLFEIPILGVPLLGFGTMMALALYASYALATWRARRVKLDPQIYTDLGIIFALGGVIGARLFFVLQHREAIGSVLDFFKFWQGGIVFYGCILGGTVGFLAYWARRRFPFRAAIDVLAPSLAIGIAVGRFGCFLNGCCYGDVCDVRWAVQFPAGSLAWVDQVRTGLLPAFAARSLPVHPTQLYAVLDGLLLLGLLSAYYPLRRRDGEVMALLAVTYPVSRFLIEILRDDEQAFVAGLTISQGISILLFLIGAAFWYYLSRLPVGRHADGFAHPHPPTTPPERHPDAVHAGSFAETTSVW
jgi:phosphatidylglycerol:prolipoprotein diacylglycerol transferase